MQERDDDLLEALERRAREQAGSANGGDGSHDADDEADLVAGLRGDENGGAPAKSMDTAPREAMGRDPAGADATLGGYMAVHDRPPAFEGSDGQPYTVGLDVEETEDPDRPFAAFFLFLRWAASGAGIMDHVESDTVAVGATEDDARQAALEMSLFEVRAELDTAIARRQRELEG